MLGKVSKDKRTFRKDKVEIVGAHEFVRNVHYATTWVLVLLSVLLVFAMILIVAAEFHVGGIQLSPTSVTLLIGIFGGLCSALAKLWPSGKP